MKKTMRQLIQETKVQIEPVPKGWKTAVQWAEDLGYGASYTQQCLTKLVKAKKILVKSFRVLAGSRVMRVSHYKEK